MNARELLEPYIDEKDILFATWNVNKGNSSDLDIYVIAKQPAISQVVMFYDQKGLWHEIFIDTEADLLKKIGNYDEIAINFLVELDFAFGDSNTYNVYLARAKEISRHFNNYPLRRLVILEYRIKVLYSKYMDSSNNALTKRFLLNSLNYYIVNLLLLTNNHLPSSPKRWIKQLESFLNKEELKKLHELIEGTIDDDTLHDWVKELTADLKDMYINKNEVNNDLTFIS